MKIKKSLLAVTTVGAVTFAGAGVANAEGSSEGGQGGGDILSSLTDQDGILGSFVGDDEFDTISHITTVIGLITAGIGLGNALDIKLPELPF